MRKRHNVENNIKKFYKMVKANQVVFDCPIQRDDKQWTNVQKSKLIRAILIDFSIPPVYSVGLQDDENQQMVYSILDGKQRLTSIVEFLDDEFAISTTVQEIEFEGELYNIKGKKFSELPEQLRDAIYDYSLTMIYYVFLTDDELAEMFDLLNSGTPLSRQQKATAYMGMDAAAKMKELKEHPFFTFNASLSKNQHTRAEDLEVITQAMMILDDTYQLDSFAGSKMNEYSALIKTGKDDVMKEISETLDYLHIALDFYTDKVVLRKTIIPMIIYIGKVAKDENLNTDLFLKWIQDFKLSIENKGKIKINYSEYMGSGSMSRSKVYGRLRAAKKHYTAFCEKHTLQKVNA